MSKMRTVALAGAVVCAVVAGMMAKNVLNRKQEVKQEIVNTVQTVDVLVATKDLLMGDKLGDGTLGWKSWPKDNVLPIMITRDAKPEAMKEFAQARVRLPIYKDEPVMDKKFIMPGAGGFMSAILPKGMRAISVAISSRSSAGGFILPNDRVDVILTKKGTDGKSSTPIVRSETVIGNVRVLAVNQVYRQATNETDPVTVEKGETATLELTPKQSEILAQVESSGELSLALRSIAENDGKSADENVPVLADKYQDRAKRVAGDPLFVRAGVESYASSQ
ncbi:MAG: Flp pilus assembly protein CpaB [Alphaproteobacteria bacterium]|nr:Flp pilus assembly protein CpaB [Alphaproteobacteria bacterium]